MFASLNLGIALIIAALVFVLLVWGVLSLLPRQRVSGQAPAAASPIQSDDGKSGDAVVVIQPGGRVDYVNTRARDWFGLRENDPADLERLLRRVRPADDFLSVCAEPGSKRLSIGGKSVEASSYRVPGAYPQMLISLRGADAVSAAGVAVQGLPSSTLRLVTEFGESVSSSLDFEAVAASILSNMLRLVPADLLELKAWDEGARSTITFRFEEANGSGRKLVRSAQSQFGDLAKEHLDGHRSVLLNQVAFGATHTSLASYLGIRLTANGEQVGTLEA